jgi:hypothetical protein
VTSIMIAPTVASELIKTISKPNHHIFASVRSTDAGLVYSQHQVYNRFVALLEDISAKLEAEGFIAPMDIPWQHSKGLITVELQLTSHPDSTNRDGYHFTGLFNELQLIVMEALDAAPDHDELFGLSATPIYDALMADPFPLTG